MKHYIGNITTEPNTIFVFGSNPVGRHEAGAAKVAREKFGAIYGQGEGLQGHSYALPTKENNGYRSISKEQIIENIKRLYECAKNHPNLDFKIAYRNVSEKSLNGYTGIEMIEMFDASGGAIYGIGEDSDIPENIWFSEEWWKYYFEYLHVVPEHNQLRIGKLIIKKSYIEN